jgi:hypothetical protein
VLLLLLLLLLQAFREEGPKQPLYRVRFAQTDVWELYKGGLHPLHWRSLQPCANLASPVLRTQLFSFATD